MKLPLALLFCSLALGFTGCQTRVSCCQEVSLTLTSALPVSYSGVVLVDGKEQSVQGKTPAVLKFQGHRLECRLKQGPEQGLLTAELRGKGLPKQAERVTASNGPGTEFTASAVLGAPTVMESLCPMNW